jgi:hypothetical protein
VALVHSGTEKKTPPARPPPPGRPPTIIRPKSHTIQEPHALVKYPFEAAQIDELSCEIGDTVTSHRLKNGELR